jgi:hypothetical protein
VLVLLQQELYVLRAAAGHEFLGQEPPFAAADVLVDWSQQVVSHLRQSQPMDQRM